MAASKPLWLLAVDLSFHEFLTYAFSMNDRRKNKTNPQHNAEGALIDTLRVSRALNFGVYSITSQLLSSICLKVCQLIKMIKKAFRVSQKLPQKAGF